MHDLPYSTVLKPYGSALLELAREREEVVCLSGDLTRQCEVDLFQDELPDRFVNAGMAEANMIGLAGALARQGHLPFVHSFGVFITRRPYDQIANAIAYPNLPVRLVGFMPGLSSPGGPSHQAIDDISLMRGLPNMTVVDAADATEIPQVVRAVADLPGPVYLRLKRGEIPVILDDDYQFSLTDARVLLPGDELALVTNGMMLAACLAAAEVLERHGVSTAVLHVPVIKPLDAATVVRVVGGTSAALTVENHSIVGGLGSAVSEAVAEAGVGRPVRRLGLRDTFAEGARDATHLFEKYGLSTQAVVAAGWRSVRGDDTEPPTVVAAPAAPGEYAPV